MIETCRSVLSVLVGILDNEINICAFIGVLIKSSIKKILIFYGGGCCQN